MQEEEFELPRWCPDPYEGESIASYLVRFRSDEVVAMSTASSLSKALRLGTALGRWEKFRFNPFPSREEIELFCHRIGLEVDKLIPTFPPKGERMKLEPICFCAACYAEAPYHRLEWQFQSTAGCDKHHLRLLSKCPTCERAFTVPELVKGGKCKCGMYVRSMAKHQKAF